MPRLLLAVAGLLATLASLHAKPVHLGVLQPEPARAAELKAAGVSLVVLSVSWDRFQPAPDRIDSAYVASLRAEAAAYRAAGLRVVLGLGIQYPPDWLRAQPHARFVNQHGDAYIDRASGKNVVNFVFNSLLRERQHDYLAGIFQHLGADWSGVRLGGGWYGEVNYPAAEFAGKANCYWAFDPIAQGQEPGLPAGIPPCPVPGWKPGQTSPDNTSARRFAEWYLDSLKNYHDWQITTARRYYNGPLMMLYPSWGIRPGQLDAAIAADLDGTTPPEKNGEIQRGFDFARFIGGIRDPRVWVQCTWLDSNPDWSDDTSADPVRWSPPKYLASLARRHNPPLYVSAENTGGGGVPALKLSAQRVDELDITALFWAFGPDLFDGRPPELKDLRPAFTPAAAP
ncbi:MAG: hypothetical protein ABII82_01450 [Verrucomicrobiota bacterium]